MSKVKMPQIVQRFENFLWVHSPSHWTLKSVYFHGTLFVTMIFEISEHDLGKIRRKFDIGLLKKRSVDLSGLASDCVDQMKSEKNDSNTK